MNLNTKRSWRILTCIVLISILLSIAVSADMGPKPSVRITVEGFNGELCYGTLLSKYDSTGPSSVWDGNEHHAHHNGNYPHSVLDYDSWKVFAEYSDPDGYYFLQEAWVLDENGEFAWTYYPPDSFKILLYFPESSLLITSGIYERYAFDSYFTAALPEGAFAAHDGAQGELYTVLELMGVERSYDYSYEILSLAARIIITILIEMVIALLFGFRGRKELILLICVNTVTQVILNVMLNLINYSSGYLAFIAAYIFFEFIVFIIEAVLYSILMKRMSDEPKSSARCVGYAFTANAVSFIAGYFTAYFIPGIF